MSAFHDNVLLGASGSQGYQISRSVRLRSSASAFFNRTPASAGSQTTWTLSMWLKRGALGANQTLFHAGTNNGPDSLFYFGANDTFDWIVRNATTATVARRTSTQVFRDPSAWAHIVCVWDTSNATAGSRMRVFYNGSEITAFSATTNPSLNLTSAFNGAVAHQLGYNTSNVQPFDGYLTEVNFIDGQALTPSSFGETDVVTGVWKPKKYVGTYGTNGFYLNFSDNSAATAAAIGKDYSGNGNNWTPNNISVTAGSTYDSMLDVPTLWADGGNGRGNYPVLNPLGNSASGTLSNANLQHTRSFAYIQANIPVSTGQWYWEVTLNALGSAGLELGILGQLLNGSNTIGGSAVGYGYDPKLGRRWVAAVSTSGQTTSTVNDVIGFAFDASSLTLQVFKNNTSLFTITGITAGEYYATCNGAGTAGTDTATFNFGQRPFSYTPPSGFKALNTLNLPTPTILKGNQWFDVSLYTGNAGSNTIVNSGGFQPDFFWNKERGGINQHNLIDAVRGAGFRLRTDATNAEEATPGTFTFNSNGFTTNTTNVSLNGSGQTYVAWQWKKGATQGFDIVTYTGNGSATQTINHSLGVVPRMIIVKNRSNLAAWPVYHASIGNGNKLVLNATSAQAATGNWASTNPTSAQFYVGGPSSEVNTSSENYVAYLFAEVAGFSKFGSYTGNGSADGPFVFLGFRPRWVMIKQSDAIRGWEIHDTARSTANAMTSILEPNSSAAENTNSAWAIDALSNGFKIRTSDASFNASGGTYIFAAFAENPFKVSLAR